MNLIYSGSIAAGARIIAGKNAGMIAERARKCSFSGIKIEALVTDPAGRVEPGLESALKVEAKCINRKEISVFSPLYYALEQKKGPFVSFVSDLLMVKPSSIQISERENQQTDTCQHCGSRIKLSGHGFIATADASLIGKSEPQTSIQLNQPTLSIFKNPEFSLRTDVPRVSFTQTEAGAFEVTIRSSQKDSSLWVFGASFAYNGWTVREI